MDRIWASRDGTGDPAGRSRSEDFVLPSRGEAVVALRSLMESHSGPVLVTGEPGVGKTWLWRRLQAEMPLGWRWVVLDLPPAIDPNLLYHLIGHGLGIPVAEVADGARLALAEFLREATADGVRWALVLDEAHNASDAVLEEVRILTNRLGRPDGLSALILVGQTALACRVSLRPMKALAARLAAHVHLRCLELEEARALLNCLVSPLGWDDRTLERHHRDSRGNPRRLIRAASIDASSAIAARCLGETETERERERPRVASSSSSQPADLGLSKPSPASPASTNTQDAWDTPMIGPFKPPLRVGDGMIEVGWEPDLDPGIEPTFEIAHAPALSSEASVNPAARQVEQQPRIEQDVAIAVSVEDETVETINDHYTALQAWNEWARNQGRNVVAAPLDSVPSLLEPAGDAGEDAPVEPARSPSGPTSVWIEGQQGFAPYGQLFSRLRQSRDVNEPS